jgi:hypothetical protein
MTGVTAGIAGDGSKAFGLLHVAHVVHQRPRPIERGGPQEIGAPGHDVARRVADAASDALDARLNCAPLPGGRLDTREIIAPRRFALELSLGTRPLVEEIAHVGREVLDHGEVGQRRDLEGIAGDDLGNVRATGPARHAVDGHRAGAAHADAARVAITEGWLEVALNVHDHVEHGLALLAPDVVSRELALLFAPPNPDFEVHL